MTQDLGPPTRAREEWFQLLVERLTDYSICLLDVEGHVISWNAGVQSIDGYREDEIIGRHFSCFFLAEAREEGMPEAILRRAAVDGRVEIEGWRLRKDGTQYWANGLITSLRDESGRVRGFCRIVRDLTERRKAEAALHNSEARLKAIVETAVDGILSIDEQGVIQTVNPAAVRLFGYRADEMIGRNVAMLMPEPYHSAHDEYIRNYLRTGEAKIIGIGREVLGRRSDGTTFPLDLAVSETRLVDRRLFTGIVRDVSERKRIEAQVRHMAHHDALTGLPNRRLLDDRLRQALALARREAGNCALLIVDLDDFKSVNDILGHAAGDRLLCLVGQRLQRILRESDTLARMGGDEFAIVLPRLGGADVAATVAQKVLDALGAVVDVYGHEVHSAASIGIAVGPGNGGHPAELVRRADVALYRAKQAGRNQYRYFEPALDAEAQARRRLERDLRRALRRGELTIAYQPQLELATGRLRGVEALLRWRHPEHGDLAPDVFVPVAESSGLIGQLGEWVAQEGCRQGRAWHERGWPLVVAVNLSGAQLRHPSRFPRIPEIFASTGMMPSRLELEITESVFTDARDDAIGSFLRQLGARGIRLVIDDFGTGYSSLAYLKSLPVEAIKIDRSFVGDIGRNGDNQAIVAAIIALGHSLGKRVLAEGVETTEQLEFLRRHNCDAAQGFLLGRPQDAGSLERMLKDRQPAP